MASFKRRLVSELLEDRRVLAQLLPDLFAWEGQNENYLHDYRIEGDLLRFRPRWRTRAKARWRFEVEQRSPCLLYTSPSPRDS